MGPEGSPKDFIIEARKAHTPPIFWNESRGSIPEHGIVQDYLNVFNTPLTLAVILEGSPPNETPSSLRTNLHARLNTAETYREYCARNITLYMQEQEAETATAKIDEDEALQILLATSDPKRIAKLDELVLRLRNLATMEQGSKNLVVSLVRIGAEAAGIVRGEAHKNRLLQQYELTDE